MNQISPELWKRVDTLFQEAISLPANEQNRFLRNLLVDDTLTAKLVRKMVEGHKQSGAFLSGTVIDSIEVQKGERIGPWKIEGQIGEGGMSTVFLASRADGYFDRDVAIKFLHGFLPGKNMVERLRKEQNILAGLNNKNICQFLDAGITEVGRPYFIMEYVDGVTVDSYCAENELSVDEILEIFLQVCEAVHYAHQRLIVHSDLKPSNILVNKGGEVKLLDFGIAKLVAEDSELDITKTHTALHLMTPEYASPEQIKNGPITTASDIYSLGLILCKLLTGQLPYDVKKSNPLEIGKVVTESDPEKPSTLLKRADRIGNSFLEKHKNWQISGISADLDNIVLMALRKNPDERYRSVEQFMQDLKNYLHDIPVIARAESTGYRVSKFIKRNRIAVSAAIVFVLVILSAALFSIHQATIANQQKQIAEQRLTDVRGLVGSMMFDVHDSIVNLPGSISVRELIVESTIGYLDQLYELDTDDVDLQLELASFFRRAANLLGSPFSANLGKHTEAAANYEKAHSLIEKALSADPKNVELLAEKALILEAIADVKFVAGNLEDARAHYQRAIETYDLIADFPESSDFSFNKGRNLLKTGDLLGNMSFTNMGFPDSSLIYYFLADSIFKSHYLQAETNVQNVRFMGLIEERIGTIYEQKYEFDTALEHYEQSMEYRNIYTSLEPYNTNAKHDLAIAYQKIAKIHRARNELEKAAVNFRQSFEILKWVADQDSLSINAIQSLAIGHLHMGDLSYHESWVNFNDKASAKDHFSKSRHLLNIAIETDSTYARNTFLMELVESRLSELD